MIKLTATLKKMLDALAHADAGEYLTLREKTAYLRKMGDTAAAEPEPAPAVAEPASASSSRRRVAMYMGSELPAEVMEYMIQTCVRLDYDLTVLTFELASTAEKLLQPYHDTLAKEGIDMKTEYLVGEPIPGLARYLRGHPEVTFMACKDSGYLGRSYLHATQNKNALPVPVVVVATEKRAADARPLPRHGITEDKSGVA